MNLTAPHSPPAATPLADRWTLALVGAYCFTYFLSDITRYKALILCLMALTAVAKLLRAGQAVRPALTRPAMFGLYGLVLAVGYGCLISPDIATSLRAAVKPVLIDGLLVAVLLPVLLHDLPADRTARVISGAFCLFAVLLMGQALMQYTQEHLAGNGLFSPDHAAHRWRSDPILITLPFVLARWDHATARLERVGLALLLPLMLAGLLATQCRGAWVPAALMLVLWGGRGRHFKTLASLCALAAASAAAVITTLPHIQLASKLQQFHDNGRWAGGSQSAAWEMIQTHVLRGHGFGDAIYHAAYAAHLPAHPYWVFRSPGIGPENSLLQLWFACGVIGVIALLGLYATLLVQSHQTFRKNTHAASDLAFAVFLVCAGALMLRGLVEAVYLNYFGLVVGLSTVFYRRTQGPS